MSIRTEKIASVVKRALTGEISRIANENKLGLASVSIVKLSKDLSVASVFISVLVPTSLVTNSKNKDLLEIINQNKGKLRSLLAKELQIRFVPELRFFYDDTLEQMQNIDNLLEKVKQNAPYKEDYGDTTVYKETT